ncbi:MAG: hypothetical protein ACREIT_08790, partial [Tepidisphaeraceae bacterium]
MTQHQMPLKVSDFHNRHCGRRAFLVGNGPSLIRTPLDLLAGEYTFAMNRIALIYEKTIWRPSFFVCTTTNITRETWKRD